MSEKKVSELFLSGLFEGGKMFPSSSLVVASNRIKEGMYMVVELARLCATNENVVDGNVNCRFILLATLLLSFPDII